MEQATETDFRPVIAAYYGMMSFVDDTVATILNALQALGLDDNTIVVFTSDHGEYLGEHGLIKKSAALYDCLTRVPLVVSWPGQIPADEPRDDLVSLVDVMPTLLSLIGLPTPTGVQGKPLPGIREDWETVRREAVFAEVGFEGEPARWEDLEDVPSGPLDHTARSWSARPIAYRGKMKMVRTDRWKYVWYQEGDGELYDLVNDPWELNNLYGRPEYWEVVVEHRERLLDWCITTEDTLPPQPATGYSSPFMSGSGWRIPGTR